MPRFLKALTSALVLLMIVPLALAEDRVSLDGEPVPYDIWHQMIMPDRLLDIGLPDGWTAEMDGVEISTLWRAPGTAGTHKLVILDQDGLVAFRIAVFVLEPAASIDQHGKLNGYRIGDYPGETPEGFIRFGQGDGDISVSPHFTLSQFLCKQQPGHFPKYLLVTQDNLERLEILLASMREEGMTTAETFYVMSGFRTPWYNRSIGSARYSRHMWGDAADVWPDGEPYEGVIDDINKDGRITKADADAMYDHAQDLFESLDGVVPGGLGSYKANHAHGPFVHVDGRGRKARWGRW